MTNFNENNKNNFRVEGSFVKLLWLFYVYSKLIRIIIMNHTNETKIKYQTFINSNFQIDVIENK